MSPLTKSEQSIPVAFPLTNVSMSQFSISKDSNRGQHYGAKYQINSNSSDDSLTLPLGDKVAKDSSGKAIEEAQCMEHPHLARHHFQPRNFRMLFGTQ